METSVLLNTGYEAPGPRILLPKGLVRALGLKEKGSPVEARTSLGTGILEDLGVSLLIETEGRVAEAEVRVSGAETEAIASDGLIEALKIEILRAKEGVYRFSDDPPRKVRKGIRPAFW
ncbi:TPA: hypothetical protein EYP44_01685 [Candidatus Bathyarchaeota archaeon]|nr:hypothetical protein [Candidatus Bathyarchaeota archaeon]